MLEITILGDGPDSNTLSALALKAANSLNLEFKLVKTANQDEIISHGVIVTPAMLIDGSTIFSGTMPGIDEIKTALEAAIS